MSHVLSEEKQKQVIALGQLGWPLRRIERETGVRRETVADYLKAAGIAVRPPGGWGHRSPAKPAKEVTTDSRSAKPAKEAQVTTDSVPSRSPSASLCRPYQERIQAGLVTGRNAMAIWQDLVDQHGFAGAYESVKRYVSKLRGSQPGEPRAVILTPPGEEAQVDYGSGPMVCDPQSGKYRRTRLFVMTLGYSRKSVRLLVWKSSTQIWAQLHEQAFRRLGGSPRLVVLDNLGEGVLKPDLYDPTLNPLYRDVLAHYSVAALPCRVGDPDRKGKVESGVGHAQKTPLKGLRFPGLEQAQSYLDHWEQRWADTRIHGTTKRQVATMFAEEKPALQPLRRWSHSGITNTASGRCIWTGVWSWKRPTTAPHPAGSGSAWRCNGTTSGFACWIDPKTGQLLREHDRQPRGRHQIDDQDRPQRTPPGILQLLARAERAGRHIGAFCQAMYREQGSAAVRRLLGLLSLHKNYGLARLDQACALALEMEVHDYRFVRRYLERNAQPPLSLRQVDPLIRQLTLYRDLIQQRTQSDSSQENPDESL